MGHMQSKHLTTVLLLGPQGDLRFTFSSRAPATDTAQEDPKHSHHQQLRSLSPAGWGLGIQDCPPRRSRDPPEDASLGRGHAGKGVEDDQQARFTLGPTIPHGSELTGGQGKFRKGLGPTSCPVVTLVTPTLLPSQRRAENESDSRPGMSQQGAGFAWMLTLSFCTEFSQKGPSDAPREFLCRDQGGARPSRALVLTPTASPASQMLTHEVPPSCSLREGEKRRGSVLQGGRVPGQGRPAWSSGDTAPSGRGGSASTWMG